jgi:hypothetical protein
MYLVFSIYLVDPTVDMIRYCDDKSFDFDSLINAEIQTLETLEKKLMWIVNFIKNILKVENPSDHLITLIIKVIDKIKQHQKDQTDKSNSCINNLSRP